MTTTARACRAALDHRKGPRPRAPRGRKRARHCGGRALATGGAGNASGGARESGRQQCEVILCPRALGAYCRLILLPYILRPLVTSKNTGPHVFTARPAFPRCAFHSQNPANEGPSLWLISAWRLSVNLSLRSAAARSATPAAARFARGTYRLCWPCTNSSAVGGGPAVLRWCRVFSD